MKLTEEEVQRRAGIDQHFKAFAKSRGQTITDLEYHVKEEWLEAYAPQQMF